MATRVYHRHRPRRMFVAGIKYGRLSDMTDKTTKATAAKQLARTYRALAMQLNERAAMLEQDGYCDHTLILRPVDFIHAIEKGILVRHIMETERT